MDQDTNSEPAAGKPISSRQSPPGDRKSEQGVVKRSGEYGRNSRGGKRRRFEGKSPNGHDGRNKGKNMGSSRTKEVGHGEYFRQNIDKRDNHQKKHQKRLEAEGEGKTRPVYLPDAFTKDEIASEDRRPKRKVAVMLGYSGSGYKGMQIMPDQRTIEGDLFQAFVAAGAISKANADDPKKSGLVRCARTDKGVHAAGNVISLKLIIEDKDIVQNINSHLSPQIRVWGIQRTTGSFSCYAACDSRWYEYLIPTHSFLPPHPSSYLATQIAKIAEEDGQLNAVSERQSEVADFWEKTEAEYIRPILESLDAETRELVEKALHHSQSMSAGLEDEEDDAMSVEDAADLPAAKNDVASGEIQQSHNADVVGQTAPEDEKASVIAQGDGKDASIALEETSEVEAAIKSLRAAYITAKRTYRIAPARLERVREALSKYVGTHNFHNFTVRKSANDPSSKRHIKSFEVASEPILIEGTEWLSLKVHGQSFMMHQIRKMVAMVALVVRCGCPPERITESMSLGVFSIPKAPGLGLLLERPVFDSYNERAESFGREDIDFGRYKKEMEEFKKREIYDRIFQMEEKDHVFVSFFAQLDNYKEPTFLFLSSRGYDAVKSTPRPVTSARSMSKNKFRELAKNSRTWDREAQDKKAELEEQKSGEPET